MSREHKSDVFSMLMEEKMRALELYNAIGGTNYTDPNELIIVKLEKGVSLTIRNDASFIVDFNFQFFEHQSTYNPNMPLRSMLYFANAMEDWVKENRKDLFSSHLIKIPVPNFVVFYNGVTKRPEYEEMRLSQAFAHDTKEPAMELICKVYNINPDNNEELKKKSPTLAGYCYFVEKVREYQKSVEDVREAVSNAIDDCIREHILEDFFRDRKDEVLKVTQLDFTWEKREDLIRREEYELGVETGREQGISQGISQGIRQVAVNMLLANKPLEEIAMLTGLSVESIQELK